MGWIKHAVAIVVAVVSVYLLWDEHRRILAMIEPVIVLSPPLIDVLSKGRKAPRLVSIERLGWRWRDLVLAGALMIFCSTQMAGAIGGAMVPLAGGEPMALLFLATVFWGLPLCYVSGRWIGRRSPWSAGMWQGVLWVIVATTLAVALSFCLRALMESTLPMAARELGIEPLRKAGAGMVLFQLLAAIGLFGVFALLGYWRGRQQIVATYVGQVLRRLAPEARNEVVGFLHDHALADSSSQPPPSN